MERKFLKKIALSLQEGYKPDLERHLKKLSIQIKGNAQSLSFARKELLDLIHHNTERPDLCMLLYTFLLNEHPKEEDLHKIVLDEFSQSSDVCTFVLNRMVEKQTDFGLASQVARSEQLILYLFSIATVHETILPFVLEMSAEKILTSPAYTTYLTTFCKSSPEIR